MNTQTRNTAHTFAPESLNKDALARAVQKLHTASSEHLNADCYTHAKIVQGFLAAFGIHTELHVGYAAWRVNGPQGHAVISHHPGTNGVQVGGVNALNYHAWLRAGSQIIDFTTYQLTDKAAVLDRADGNHTDVTWAPAFLWVDASTCSTYQEVAQSYSEGVYCYDRIPLLESMLNARALDLDPADLVLLLTVYRSEEAGINVDVRGPFGQGRASESVLNHTGG